MTPPLVNPREGGGGQGITKEAKHPEGRGANKFYAGKFSFSLPPTYYLATETMVLLLKW